jgi:lysophospholipase L1-like esterase
LPNHPERLLIETLEIRLPLPHRFCHASRRMNHPLPKLIAVAMLSATLLAPAKTPEEPVTEAPVISTVPAERMGEDWWRVRFEGSLSAVEKQPDAQLVFLGDSITQGWEGAGAEAWKKHFSPRKPLNLGFSGDRTEHLIWRLQNGKLGELKPKAAVVMIGTNNTGHNQRPAEDTAAGIELVLEEIHKLWPETEIVLLAIFPRGETLEDPLRKLNSKINQILSEKVKDQKHVHFLDLASVFTEEDGKLPKAIMPDLLHLSKEGYERWAEALEPKLKELGL